MAVLACCIGFQPPCWEGRKVVHFATLDVALGSACWLSQGCHKVLVALSSALWPSSHCVVTGVMHLTGCFDSLLFQQPVFAIVAVMLACPGLLCDVPPSLRLLLLTVCFLHSSWRAGLSRAVARRAPVAARPDCVSLDFVVCLLACPDC